MDWLRSAIHEHGVTQRELAASAGLSESAMSKILSGHRALKASEADAMRRRLGYALPEDLKPGTTQRRIMDRLAELDERQQAVLAAFLDTLTGRTAQR